MGDDTVPLDVMMMLNTMKSDSQVLRFLILLQSSGTPVHLYIPYPCGLISAAVLDNTLLLLGGFEFFFIRNAEFDCQSV
jgi:hypothetical protein